MDREAWCLVCCRPWGPKVTLLRSLRLPGTLVWKTCSSRCSPFLRGRFLQVLLQAEVVRLSSRVAASWATSLTSSAVCGRSTLLLTPWISGFSEWRGGGETCEWRQWPPWSSSSLGGLHCRVSRENCRVSCRGSVLSRAEPPVWLAVGADRALPERARGSWGGGPAGAHMRPGWQRGQSLG